MKYVSLFSGIEAATVAWEPLGWEPLAFAEIEPFPCAVLAYRFPDVPNLGDVTKIDWSDFAKRHGTVDLVCGGTPCQSFSIAGKREGLSGASGLMWEYVRAIRELRPHYFVWENVPGALSSGKGDDFRCLLCALDECGYGMAWRILDAQFFGVAQRRRRVWLVGVLGDPERAAEILFEPDSLRRAYPSSREKRKELSGASGSGAGGACFAIAGNIIGRKPENGGHHLGIEDDGACYSLTTADRHAVAHAVRMRAGKPGGGGRGPLVQTDVSGTLATGNDQTIFQPVYCMANGQANSEIETDLCPPMVVYSDDETPMVLYEGVYWTVRRLMPVECERLQGFQDDWTRIPYRGKPAEQCPDGPRCKALGNSWAVPCARWIGERIERIENGTIQGGRWKRW